MQYKNAIANELFLVTAAKLNRTDWALKEWQWFERSGMINNQSLINDGLDGDCRNNKAATYTYNQGVILGGLAHLYFQTGNQSLLRQGEAIADAVINLKTDHNGVLTETGCGDGALFKGIFVRYLRYFMTSPLIQTKIDQYEAFLKVNANSVWQNSQDAEGKFGGWWGGHTVFESASVGLQVAAIDVLTAAKRPQTTDLDLPGSCLHGRSVSGRCICDTRFVGGMCEKEVNWARYYTNRKVVIMTSSGRFVSSGGYSTNQPQLLWPTQSHMSDQEKFTVQNCGGGVGLQDSAGYWLSVSNRTGKYQLEALPAQHISCDLQHSNVTFLVSEGPTGGLVALQSAVASNLYLGTEIVREVERVVVQELGVTTRPYPRAELPPASYFHISLDQICQDF